MTFKYDIGTKFYSTPFENKLQLNAVKDHLTTVNSLGLVVSERYLTTHQFFNGPVEWIVCGGTIERNIGEYGEIK